MKYIYFAAIAFLTSTTLYSCQKPYTCTCTGSISGNYQTQLKASSEKEASEKCDAIKDEPTTPKGINCRLSQ